MNLERYTLEADETGTTFEFTSAGPKGFITKVIQFRRFPSTPIYNLAFGDRLGDTGLDDSVVSSNGDVEKILVTIVEAVYQFTSRYPDAIVYATGSSPARTRLYKMGLSRYLEMAQSDFDVYGERDEDFEPFQKHGIYTAFMVKRKKH